MSAHDDPAIDEMVARAIAAVGAEGASDAAAGKYIDLIDAGIIDPTKVVRLALENAVSVAGVLLLTEPMMTDVAEPKLEPALAGEAA